jgi:hypothetical protein
VTPIAGRNDHNPGRHWQDREYQRDNRNDVWRARDFTRRHRDCDLYRDRDTTAAKRPEYETRSIGLGELEDIVTRMHGFSVRDPAYTVLYAPCKRRFADTVEELAKPDMFQVASTVAPVSQSWRRPNPAPPSRINRSPHLSSLGTARSYRTIVS